MQKVGPKGLCAAQKGHKLLRRCVCSPRACKSLAGCQQEREQPCSQEHRLASQIGRYRLLGWAQSEPVLRHLASQRRTSFESLTSTAAPGPSRPKVAEPWSACTGLAQASQLYQLVRQGMPQPASLSLNHGIFTITIPKAWQSSDQNLRSMALVHPPS